MALESAQSSALGEAMRRREFVTILGSAVVGLSAHCSAQSQPLNAYKLGYLAPARIPHLIEALQDGLRKLGYVEGQNLKIEYRFPQGGGASIDELADELVQFAPDVFITVATPPAIAAKRATTTIPIVMATAGDPLSSGIVASLAHPGGNITGVTLYAADLSGKRLEIFKKAVPASARVAVLGNQKNPLSLLLWHETQAAAQPLGLDARLYMVQEPRDLSTTFEAVARDGADGVVILSDALFNSVRQMIVALAAQHRLPAVYEASEFVEDGGLISYGPNIDDMTRQSAAYVDKILKGAKPANLPIQQPTKFDLVINLKTARALGLAIPENLLILAHKVIE
jgi:putative ABC transport system substrate-binding protein